MDIPLTHDYRRFNAHHCRCFNMLAIKIRSMSDVNEQDIVVSNVL